MQEDCVRRGCRRLSEEVPVSAGRDRSDFDDFCGGQNLAFGPVTLAIRARIYDAPDDRRGEASAAGKRIPERKWNDRRGSSVSTSSAGNSIPTSWEIVRDFPAD